MKDTITKTNESLAKALESNESTRGFIKEAIEALTKAAESMQVTVKDEEGYTPENGVYAIRETEGHTMFLSPAKLEEMKSKGEDISDIEEVAVITDLFPFKIKKNAMQKGTFAEAQKIAAAQGEGWRCPNRHECIEIYNARFQGLDKALELIGGDPVRGCIWTCEEDPDPEFSQSNAFYFGGDSGHVNTGSKYYTYAVRALSALEKF
jgi:hypothetical protein